MLQAINLFSPLIQKYSKKLFFIDREDAEQEMTLAFISTIHKMNYFHSPGECISFINKGLYRRFCVLCKENPQNAEMTTDFISLPDFEFEERYPDIDLICDYQKHLEKLPSIYTEIFHLLLKGYSDREIAAQLHFSKQYINRIKKKIVPISFFGQYNPQKDKSREWITKKLMLRQIIFLLLHQLFTIAFLIAVQQKRFFMKAFRRSYDSVSRHYKFPELKNTEDIGNKTIGFQKTVNSFCKNIIFSFNARIA